MTGDGSDICPEGGDWTLCIRCGALHVYNDDFSLRAPTDYEQDAANSDPDVQDLVARINRIHQLN